MLNVYQFLRYIVFGIFIVSSAIIASVAVWNISLLQVLALNLPVVPYLIFVGSFGLAFIFAVIFIELARRNAITSRVFFELCWVSLFFILELAGAIAYSVIVPSKMCSKKVTRAISSSCVSTQVLQAFTLIITITLFGYLSVLLMSCIRHGRFAWQSNVRDLVALPSEHTDTSSRFLDRGGTIVAPQPRRPHFEWTYRSGLDPDYEIEHYQPPAAPMPTASSSHRQNRPPAFYPQVVQSSLTTQPLPFSMLEAEQSNMSPSPLGDWPRMDVLQQPTRSRKLPVASQGMVMETSPRQRPTGPRKQSEERRPPPLDLSKITSFKNMPP